MTTPAAIREFTGVVKSLGKAQKGEGWALALEPRDGMQYPDTWYGQDWAIVKDLEPGHRIKLTLQRGRLKPNKSPGSTAPWDYYEDALKVEPAPAAISEPPRVPAIGPARVPTGRDASIEQQVASKNRTELAIACLQQAVAYHDRLPDGARAKWADVVKAANDAYDMFRDVAEVLRWQQPAPEGEAPGEDVDV